MQTLFAFQNAVRREKGHFLVVDLIGVPYVDSAGGGSIVLAHVSSENAGKRLIVSGANERVRTVLQVTRVSQVLTLTPSVGEAEQALVDRDANP